MKFHAKLIDAFGTVSGEGDIEMNAGSVFECGIAAVRKLRKGAMEATALPLTREQHEGQVQQITGPRYVQQGTHIAWRIELTEAES